jgi:hypothetical protein
MINEYLNVLFHISMEQHFTTGFSTNICFPYASNSFSEMLKEHQCDVATYAHEIFILVNLRKDAVVQISPEKMSQHSIVVL